MLMLVTFGVTFLFLHWAHLLQCSAVIVSRAGRPYCTHYLRAINRCYVHALPSAPAYKWTQKPLPVSNQNRPSGVFTNAKAPSHLETITNTKQSSLWYTLALPHANSLALHLLPATTHTHMLFGILNL